MPYRLSLACTLALVAACGSEQKGPPIQFVVAHGIADDGRCIPASGAAPNDPRVTAAGISTMRISIRLHANGDTQGSFACDRILRVPTDQPNIKLSLKGADTFDIYAEGFNSVDPTDPTKAQRVASGALLGVSVKSKTIPPVRLFPAEDYRCVDARLGRARAFHSATRLPNGQVLFVGGLVASGSDQTAETLVGNHLFLIGDAEIFDPASGKFSTVTEDATPTPRAFHAAALLNNTPPYQILLVGGITTPDASQPALAFNSLGLPQPRLVPEDGATSFPTHAADAEILTYDPSTGTASRTSAAGFARAAYPASTPLPGGDGSTDGLAIAGGVDWGTPPDNFVPTKSLAVQRGAESAPRTGTPQAARAGATLTPITDNSALMWGGVLKATDPVGELVSGLSTGGAPSSVAVVAANTPPTQFHTATSFASDGMGMAQILVTGGFQLDTGTGHATQPPRADAAARVVNVAAGNVSAAPLSLGGGYVADPSCMASGRYKPAGWESAVALPRGRVLVTGGAPTYIPNGGCNDCDQGGSQLCSLAQSSLFTAPSDFRPTNSLEVGRFGHTSTLLADGSVLVVGGLNLAQGAQATRTVADAEVYNPRTLMPPIDLSQSPPVDVDDPLGPDLAAQSLARSPGQAAFVAGGDPNKPARRCGDF
jgi:hypothetical protein